jgi:hypothetical protein
MDTSFERKLRAAVSAGVRVLVVEVGLLSLVWALYLVFIGARPGWALALWGPEVSWPWVAAITLGAVALFKVFLWIQAALLAWGWLWAATLRRMRAGAADEQVAAAGGAHGPYSAAALAARGAST